MTTSPHKPSVLVTGASGFLGKHIVARLHQDFKVRSMSRTTEGLEGEIFPGSVADLDTVEKAVKSMDALVLSHMAPNRPETYANAEVPFDVNVKGTAHLLECAVKEGIRRIVLISSISVLERQRLAGTRISADLPPGPVNLYTLTKTLQETMARYYHENFGLEIIVLRPAYIVLEDSICDKYGRKSATVNWQFIDPRDIADATAAALLLPEASFDIFHLVAGPGAEEHSDVTRAHQVLGWAPKYTFSQYPVDA